VRDKPLLTPRQKGPDPSGALARRGVVELDLVMGLVFRSDGLELARLLGLGVSFRINPVVRLGDAGPPCVDVEGMDVAMRIPVVRVLHGSDPCDLRDVRGTPGSETQTGVYEVARIVDLVNYISRLNDAQFVNHSAPVEHA
jgi:hypothetical protein